MHIIYQFDMASKFADLGPFKTYSLLLVITFFCLYYTVYQTLGLHHKTIIVLVFVLVRSEDLESQFGKFLP